MLELLGITLISGLLTYGIMVGLDKIIPDQVEQLMDKTHLILNPNKND